MAVVLMPRPAHGQVEEEKTPAPVTTPVYKYNAFVGWGYTSLNQINQSRSGVMGVTVSATRNWGRFFGLTAQGGHYAWAVTQSNALVGDPSVDLFLIGPELHAPLYGRASIYAHALLGGAHTGNVSIAPTISFAGGMGMGMDYKLNKRMSLRLGGDDIESSFTLVPYQPGDSPHKRWNGSALFGVVYAF